MILQAIETKFIPASNVRGSRIRAQAASGTRFFGYDHSLNADQNHACAAELFARAVGWNGEWHGGCVKSGAYVWVLTDKSPEPKRDCFTI